MGAKGSREKGKKANVRSEYTLHKKVLGRGSFGTVKLATRKSDRKEFAIKIIKKKELREEEICQSSI